MLIKVESGDNENPLKDWEGSEYEIRQQMN